MVNKPPLQKWIIRILPHRLWVQISFLAVWLDPLGLRCHWLCAPVFHCYACPLATFACPIGVMAQFSALHLIPFAAIGLILVVGGALGAILCGWACPFGLLQDLTAKLPLPKLKIHPTLGYGRYVMLVGTVILIPFLWGEHHPLFVCYICPAGAVEKALPDMIGAILSGELIPWPNPLKIAILVVFGGAAFFSIRPWCRILCPLGGLFGLLNKTSMISIQLDDHRCTRCNRCRTLCRYGVTPDQEANDAHCLRCLECTQCQKEALRVVTAFDKPGQ